MIKACIFDLDGTLANTLPSIAYFANKALQAYGLKEIEAQQYRWLVGDGAAELVKRILVISGDPEMKKFDEVYQLYKQSYDDDFLYLTDAYPGILDTLVELKKRSIRLGVLSNKPHPTTCKVVESLFGSGFFDCCYGQRPEMPLKPDPSMLLNILKEFGVMPEECLYFGDTAVDMLTGKRAGVKTVGVLWGFRDKEELEAHEADVIVAHPFEILKLI